MELELTVIDDKAEKVKGKVAIKPITFYNIDFVEPLVENLYCKISSGGIIYTVMESAESVKSKIRSSNMRESSLIVNI